MKDNTKWEEGLKAEYSKKQVKSFNQCLKNLNGLTYKEAERVLLDLISAAKNKSKITCS